jgi:hypothetical protein
MQTGDGVTCPNCGTLVTPPIPPAPKVPGSGAEVGEPAKGGSTLATLLHALADVLGITSSPGPDGSVEVESVAASVAGARQRVTRRVPIVKIETERRLVYGVVYEPGVYDAHEDAMTAEEIEKACHSFGLKYARLEAEQGVDHAYDVARDQVSVVETYIAPAAFQLGKQTVTKGSWIMVSKVHDEALWADVKAGKLTGYSFEGWGRRVPAAV